MSAATKRKHVTREVEQELFVPEGHQFIAKIIGGRGNNLHEVETPEKHRFLVSMPTKFRKNVWVKRGGFVLCQPISEGEKVKGEIIHVLYKHNIDHIKKEGLWPRQFQDEDGKENSTSKSGAYCDDEMMPPSDEEGENEEEGFETYNPNYEKGAFADQNSDQ